MKVLMGCMVWLLLLSSNVGAAEWFEKFDKKDWVRQGIFTGLQATDCLQTISISKDSRFIETNPILGEDPSKEKIIAYFTITTGLHTGISYLLPPKYEFSIFNWEIKTSPRAWWQNVWIGIQTYQTVKNYQLGVRFSF